MSCKIKCSRRRRRNVSSRACVYVLYVCNKELLYHVALFKKLLQD